MALPTDRESFKQYCLRRLGAPVIEINISDDQLEDRIDDALQYFWDYHFEGSEKIYIPHQVTAGDITARGFQLPPNIIGAVQIFDIGYGLATGTGIFNLQYQLMLNDMHSLFSADLISYWMAIERIQFMEEIIVGHQPIRHNRHKNFLHIDMDWNKVSPGNWLIVEAYQVLDPDVYTATWNDRWLLRYATALVKRQVGQNLIKFEGMMLPGNVVLNGRQWYDDAEAEIQQLEAEMLTSYSLPAGIFIG